LRDERFEIHARQIFADVPESMRQILVDAILSAFAALGAGIGGMQHVLAFVSELSRWS
jgi:hypothetical protein